MGLCHQGEGQLTKTTVNEEGSGGDAGDLGGPGRPSGRSLGWRLGWSISKPQAKNKALESDKAGFSPDSATSKQMGLGKVTLPLWTLVPVAPAPE